MFKFCYFSLVLIILTSGFNISGKTCIETHSVLIDDKTGITDTTKENQLLFNGRVWRNLYYKVRKDQFLYSKDFLKGSVTINGKTFADIPLRYDIYNDEIQTPANSGLILQLNKELIDSFSVSFENRIMHFERVRDDSLKGFKGYVNVLYKGKNVLYVKHRKEIELLAVEKKYDEFYETRRVFLLKDNNVYPVTGRRDFLKILEDHKQQIRDFIKKNRLIITLKDPESFIEVIRFYDSLSQ